MNTANNAFISKTIEGLQTESIKPELLAPRGFDIEGINENKEQCVLMMGLNPAGSVMDAEREKDNTRTYLYCLNENSKIKSDWLYNKYFRPIYNFVNHCLKEEQEPLEVVSAKWPWCNKPWDAIEKEIIRSPDLSLSDEIEVFYQKHQDCQYTIYIGDMFYYHITNSKKLPLLIGKQSISYKKYCEEMLLLHIKELEKHNKSIKFVYINNAQVSHWLADGEHKTFGFVPGTPIKIFYGGMLSGMRCMDAFSLERLVQEIRREMAR